MKSENMDITKDNLSDGRTLFKFVNYNNLLNYYIAIVWDGNNPAPDIYHGKGTTEENALEIAIAQYKRINKIPAKTEIQTLIEACQDRNKRAELYWKYNDPNRYTFQVGNKLTHEIKDLKDSEEMKSYVKRYIENINQERRVLNLIEININDVYKILGESYTCFWRIKGE